MMNMDNYRRAIIYDMGITIIMFHLSKAYVLLFSVTIQHFWKISEGGSTLMVSLTVKYPFFYAFPIKLICQILPLLLGKAMGLFAFASPVDNLVHMIHQLSHLLLNTSAVNHQELKFYSLGLLLRPLSVIVLDFHSDFLKLFPLFSDFRLSAAHSHYQLPRPNSLYP